jgi:Putative transposase
MPENVSVKDRVRMAFDLGGRENLTEAQQQLIRRCAMISAQCELMEQETVGGKHLGAHIGLTAVLHTWGSALTHHPHVHIIVPGGGLSRDGSRWIACKPGFFLPVRVLSAVPSALPGRPRSPACRRPPRLPWRPRAPCREVRPRRRARAVALL